MAIIKPEPPQAPLWHLTISEDERNYILAAFDFARAMLNGNALWSDLQADWPLAPDIYLREIGLIEQAVASVSAGKWRNG